jgi:NADPH:quinone reductase-like Zn-dependent oxidoreductase
VVAKKKFNQDAMKASFYDRYGPPEVLRIIEQAKPLPGNNEVLVKVHAASINSWDWDMLRGQPFIVRRWGLTRPRFTTPGADIAGVVEAVGSGVTKFKVGDAVFGDLAERWGGFAEYVKAPETALAKKPDELSFTHAAAFPQAGALALQAIKDRAQVKPGQKVLINGAGGGVGTLAIQMAKSYGATVTAVDSAPKLDKLRSIGADFVIDYAREDFIKNGQHYDVIIDVVSNRPVFAYKGSLTTHGLFIMLGGTMSSIFQAMLFGRMISGDKKLGILGYQPNKDLDVMASLCLDGKVVPLIDKSFPLSDVAGAFRHFGTGNFVGKVIITFTS